MSCIRRSTSPLTKKPSSPFSSTSSSSSSFSRLIPKSSSAVRSSTPSKSNAHKSFQDMPLDESRSNGGHTISVTIRFRPLSEREYQKGDEIAWYADGDKIVRNEYNHATAYAFDRVFGPSTVSDEVYDVAARPVVKAAMEGVTGTVFAYGVTSSGKTHTMHGDQSSPGVIPLAIKDVFSMIQDVSDGVNC